MNYMDYPDNRPPGRAPKYPLRKLAVGESFFVPGIHINEICKRTYHFKPLKFTSKTVISNGVQGVRVRRIA
jgi:hypothetical protein